MDLHTTIYLLVGFTIVLFFAVNYFNDPPYHFVDEGLNTSADEDDVVLEPALPKYFTDRFEYNLYLFAYVLVSELIFVLLTVFLPDLIDMSDETATDSLVPTRQNIVLATLIITGIAPNLPFIRKLLEKSKLYLHKKAQIPKKGRDVYRKIKASTPSYSNYDINKIIGDARFVLQQNVEASGRPDLHVEDFESNPFTLEGRWAKLSYLLYYVNSWGQQRPFKNYLGNRELRRDSIENAYREIQKEMAAYKAGTLSENDRINLNKRMDRTLHRTYRLISCLLYLAGKSDFVVDEYLYQLGYSPEETQYFPIPWKRLALVILSITASIVIGGLIAFGVAESGMLPVDTEIRTHNIFRWVGYAVPFLALPILFVLLTKRYLSTRSEAWPVVTETNRYRRQADRPWHIYALITVVGYITGALVLLVLVGVYMFFKGTTPTLNVFSKELMSQVFVWSGVVLVTVAYTAYRLDTVPDPNKPKPLRYTLRVTGALSQGAVTTAAVFIAYVHTRALGDLNPLHLPDVQQSKLVIYCVIAFFLGTSVFFTSNFGRLREKRKDGRRRKINQPVLLQIGETTIKGRIFNFSRGGALVSGKGLLVEPGENIDVRDEEGGKASATIVNTRGNFLHLQFIDKDTWKKLQELMGLRMSLSHA